MQLFRRVGVTLNEKGQGMEFVMGGLFALGIVLLALWAWSLAASARRDRQEAEARAREEQERHAREAQEARMRRKGERLQCLGCGRKFLGPLTDDGCPQCHLSALVVTQAEAKEKMHGDTGR